MPHRREARRRELAWIGDAVLALFARRWILANESAWGGHPSRHPDARARLFTQMTSNDFLATVGQPTAVEAQIGEVFENEGLEAAFAHIESTLLPIFRKQLAARLRGHK